MSEAVHKAELSLLRLANEQGKLALSVSYTFADNPAGLEAYEYIVNNQLWMLVDITTALAAAPGIPMKVFKLTEAGLIRRQWLETIYGDKMVDGNA